MKSLFTAATGMAAQQTRIENLHRSNVELYRGTCGIFHSPTSSVQYWNQNRAATFNRRSEGWVLVGSVRGPRESHGI